MVATLPAGCPTSGVDLWSDATLADPYPAFAAVRAAGPVVWLERHGLFAFPRFDEVHAALADWRTFSSARGVGLDDQGSGMGENIIASDPPAHSAYRKPIVDQLTPSALAGARAEVRDSAARFATAAVEAGTFDAVADLARPYSLAVVADLVGLPEAGRDAYPALAERAFNVFGPPGPRTADGLAAVGELVARTLEVAGGDDLEPGRWGDELRRQGWPLIILSYTWPGIDTTVNALATAVLLFARHPDQWQAVRADRGLIPSAFNEVLRLHSPVQFFTRFVTGDVDVAGVTIPAGSRVLVMYGSANRDERRFPDPDRFDVQRDAGGQLAFGRGIHLCAGLHLARLEGHALLEELAGRVTRFELTGEPRWLVNHTLHGPATVPVRTVRTA